MGTTAVYNIISGKKVTRLYSDTAGDFTSPLSVIYFLEGPSSISPDKITSGCYTNPRFPGEIILTPSEGGSPVFREIGQKDTPSAATWITIDLDRGALRFAYDRRYLGQETNSFTVRIEDALDAYNSNLFNACEKEDYYGYISVMNSKLESLLRGLSINGQNSQFEESCQRVPKQADPGPQKGTGRVAVKKPALYIAYGSNLNLKQMAHRCPTARTAGIAHLQNYELLFRGASVRGGRGAVATVEPKAGTSVPILLWKIREKDEQALDRYEGFPHFYHKEQMDVELNGQSVSAMVYVMNPGHELGLPGSSYYQTIAEGYKSAGFDLAVLDAAVEESYNRALREEREFVQAFDENQLTLFGEEQEMKQSEFACKLETMVENPSPEKTLEWERFTHTAGEVFGPGEENRLLYCDELLSEMIDVLDEFGQDIVDQLYQTGGMDYLDLHRAAEYLRQGGDPNMLEDLSGSGRFIHL